MIAAAMKMSIFLLLLPGSVGVFGRNMNYFRNLKDKFFSSPTIPNERLFRNSADRVANEISTDYIEQNKFVPEHYQLRLAELSEDVEKLRSPTHTNKHLLDETDNVILASKLQVLNNNARLRMNYIRKHFIRKKIKVPQNWRVGVTNDLNDVRKVQHLEMLEGKDQQHMKELEDDITNFEELLEVLVIDNKARVLMNRIRNLYLNKEIKVPQYLGNQLSTYLDDVRTKKLLLLPPEHRQYLTELEDEITNMLKVCVEHHQYLTELEDEIANMLKNLQFDNNDGSFPPPPDYYAVAGNANLQFGNNVGFFPPPPKYNDAAGNANSSAVHGRDNASVIHSRKRKGQNPSPVQGGDDASVIPSRKRRRQNPSPVLGRDDVPDV